MRGLYAILAAATLTFSYSAWAATPEAPAAGDAPEKVVYDADSAFRFLQTLGGDWERGKSAHDHGGGSRLTKFRVSGAGSTVIETIFPDQPQEMVTVYHRDGDDLLLTHYCALHNAPVMKFAKSDKPGEINFVFVGGTNFDPKSSLHVHEGTMRIKDANTIESSFVTFDDGKAGPAVTSVMKRKPKPATP